MCRWLKRSRGGFTASYIRQQRSGGGGWVVGEKRKQYHKAYDYLRKRIRFLDYCEYRRNHLPIGSGVTEAAGKTVFTQRLKQSGMTWSLEGGQWIVDLRVVHLSGIWPQVYQAYLQAKNLPEMGTQEGSRRKSPEKPHNPWHSVPSHPIKPRCQPGCPRGPGRIETLIKASKRTSSSLYLATTLATSDRSLSALRSAICWFSVRISFSFTDTSSSSARRTSRSVP